MLDEVLATVRRADGGRPRVFLKMDTQGFDLEVFGGLGEWQQDVVGLQSEVALLLIYEGMPRMREALDVYEAAGYEISGLYPVTRRARRPSHRVRLRHGAGRPGPVTQRPPSAAPEPAELSRTDAV